MLTPLFSFFPFSTLRKEASAIGQRGQKYVALIYVFLDPSLDLATKKRRHASFAKRA